MQNTVDNYESIFGLPAVVVPISPIALTLSSPYHDVISISNNPFLHFIK
jgi:hypothetical protein